MADGEGTFSLCSFWYVEALTRAGRLADARLALEKMFTYANHLGQYHLKKPWKKGGHSIFRRYKWYAIPKIADSEPLPANETLPVECTWCDMRFQDNSQLKFHILHVHL